MTPSELQDHEALAQAAHHRKTSSRADLWQSMGWVALGGATLVESLRMDRLTHQDINPYTIPGLLPACLGVAIMLLGLLMAYRSISRGALGPQPVHPAAAWQQRRELSRIWFILTLCVGFAVGVVGHGLSFWLAAAAFITVMVVVLQFETLARQRRLWPGVFKAVVIGLCAGIIITLVFQEFFLVRLP
ncbi:MAG: hypothetical protein RIT26_1505 [Pseudomonadota bacterium]|jgi:hypothetical protein